ncbi:unknown protein [Seminavis robusta]|uniref:G-protein coupled receptors family 2 profile 2 domain-containing protein n=1 Tax=Seminavis robusta TaxID=568900 RepID=A0A9N8HB43_9STRA|nr:unknown protein [Seminavis robusta]|eukprot:Sro322_g117040.1 n/a (456) ;mRNA; f:37025-38392
MCILDLFTSVSHSLSTWPIPAATSTRWGASGTDGTCTAQGFFLQLSIASPIYNFMLMWFFLLKVKYSYTDAQIHKCIEPSMHTFAFLFGFGTALVCLGLNMYHDSSLWCWVNATPIGCKQTFRHGYTTCEEGDNAEIFRWAFYFGPLWASVLGAMVAMFMLYQYVRKTEKQARQYDFELTQAKKLLEEQELEDDGHLSRDSSRDSSRASSVYSISSALSNSVHSLTKGSMKAATSLYKHTLWKKKYDSKKKDYRQSKIVARQAYRYVAVFYVTWIAGTTNRLLQLTRGESFFWLMALHATFTPMQGFFNFLVYMYPKWEAKRLKRKKELAKKQKQKLDNTKTEPNGPSVEQSPAVQQPSQQQQQQENDMQDMELPPIAEVPSEVFSVSGAPPMDHSRRLSLIDVSEELDGISLYGEEDEEDEAVAPELPSEHMDLSKAEDEDDSDDEFITYSTQF